MISKRARDFALLPKYFSGLLVSKIQHVTRAYGYQGGKAVGKKEPEMKKGKAKKFRAEIVASCL
jgi:hypothetical protein